MDGNAEDPAAGWDGKGGSMKHATKRESTQATVTALWLFAMLAAWLAACSSPKAIAAEPAWWKPYSPPCVERENVFEFAEQPRVKNLGNDKYEITFAVASKGGSSDGGYCDVTVAIIDPDPTRELVKGRGVVVRHLASGVLGPNAPPPFQKNSTKQTLYWDGKDDLQVYVRDPQKLQVRVSLGLKPEFERHLGGTSPRNLAGWVAGIAADENGVYVWTKGRTGRGRDAFRIRAFDHDGNYLRTLLPPSADLPEEKLGGYGYVEYEPGKRTVHGPNVYRSVMRYGFFHNETSLELSGGTHHVFERASQNLMPQPAVHAGRTYYLTAGFLRGGGHKTGSPQGAAPTLHYLNVADGSTDYKGHMGRPIGPRGSVSGRENENEWFPLPTYRLATSPDGKWLYITGVCRTATELVTGISKTAKAYGFPAVLRCATDGDGHAEVLIGELRGEGGTAEGQLMWPRGLDCDPQGRIYVADYMNRRLQIFTPEGKFVKTVPVAFPMWVGVHKKTGAVYVLHRITAAETSGMQVSKFSAFPALERQYSAKVPEPSPIMAVALDSWSERPRLWLGRGIEDSTRELAMNPFPGRLIVWEEDGKTLRKFLDFDAAARADDGPALVSPWQGNTHQNNLACDPTREHFYWRLRHVFHLPTGTLAGYFLANEADIAQISPFNYRDLALWDARFCKRGYMHVAFLNEARKSRGIVRFHSGVTDPTKSPSPAYAECPYDYGTPPGGTRPGGTMTASTSWLRGVLEIPQQCYRPWNHGFGVNMAGDIAAAAYVGFFPKMELGKSVSLEPLEQYYGLHLRGRIERPYTMTWNDLVAKEELHYLPRRPGIPLLGPTIWTFDHTGQLKEKDAVISGPCSIHGVNIDEDGKVYFACSGVRVMSGTRTADGPPFLAGRGGNYGGEAACAGNRSPLTGVYMKTRGSNVRFFTRHEDLPALPLEDHEIPDRHHDLCPSQSRERIGGCTGWWDYGQPDSGSEDLANIGRVWVEGAEWIYAGYSPISDRGCLCPQTRPHLDWFKRSFVLEMYRRSFAALDTNGNLILHFGRYGNFDDALKATRRPRTEDDGITVCFTDQIAGTDNYLVYCDYGERLVVLKIAYHVEQIVPIQAP